MTHEIKLYYFNIKGRAEPIRLALFVGGVEFTDVRVSGPEFAGLKQSGKFPLAQLPCLEVDGKMYCQSKSLLRLAGKLSKEIELYPRNALKAAIVDQLVDTVDDLVESLQDTYGIKDLQERIKARQELCSGKMKTKAEGVEKLFTMYSQGAFVLGSDISIADLFLFQMVQYFQQGILDGVPTDYFDQYNRIMDLYESVKQHPKVVEWYSKK